MFNDRQIRDSVSSESETAGGGTALELVAGAVATALAGKVATDSGRSRAEKSYWRACYSTGPNPESGRALDDASPANDLDRSSQGSGSGEVDAEARNLSCYWQTQPIGSGLSWAQARQTMREALESVDVDLTDGLFGDDPASTEPAIVNY